MIRITADNVERYLDSNTLYIKARDGWTPLRRNGNTRRYIDGSLATIPVRFGPFGRDIIMRIELANTNRYRHVGDLPDHYWQDWPQEA